MKVIQFLCFLFMLFHSTIFAFDNDSDILVYNKSNQIWKIRDAHSRKGNMYFFRCDAHSNDTCNNFTNVYCKILNDWESCDVPAKTLVGVQFTTTNGVVDHCLNFLDHNGKNNADGNGGICDQNDGYSVEKIPFFNDLFSYNIQILSRKPPGILKFNEFLNPRDIDPSFFDAYLSAAIITQDQW